MRKGHGEFLLTDELNHPVMHGESWRRGAWWWLVDKCSSVQRETFDYQGDRRYAVTLQVGQFLGGRNRLAKAWGVTPKQVRRFMADLIDAGLIARATVGATVGATGRATRSAATNVYEITGYAEARAASRPPASPLAGPRERPLVQSISSNSSKSNPSNPSVPPSRRVPLAPMPAAAAAMDETDLEDRLLQIAGLMYRQQPGLTEADVNLRLRMSVPELRAQGIDESILLEAAQRVITRMQTPTKPTINWPGKYLERAADSIVAQRMERTFDANLVDHEKIKALETQRHNRQGSGPVRMGEVMPWHEPERDNG